MINLMYVVLMAMLALNTPTEEELGVKGKSLVEKVKRSLQDEPRTGDEKKDVKLVELNVSEMNAFVIPEKTTLYAGERFNSQVVMAAIDSTQRPEIYVNGSRLQAADGRYSFTAGGVGEHQFNGYILMKGKDGEDPDGVLSSIRSYRDANVSRVSEVVNALNRSYLSLDEDARVAWRRGAGARVSSGLTSYAQAYGVLSSCLNEAQKWELGEVLSQFK